MPSINVHGNYVCLNYFNIIYVCLTHLHDTNVCFNNLDRSKFTNITVYLIMRNTSAKYFTISHIINATMNSYVPLIRYHIEFH